MKNTFKALLLQTWLLLTALQGKADVSLFFAAHQDDWQLFMGTNAYWDMKAIQSNPNDLVVIFHITAGDAGGPMSYVAAREDCSMNSIRLAASAGTGPVGSVATGTVTVGGHTIMYKVYGNVVSFFFRLPDGCFSVAGCTGAGSLEGLNNGTYGSLTAVDGSATYWGWGDLIGTVQSIVGWYNFYNNFFYPGTKLWINHPDINTSINPGDHPDHFYTGVIAEQASYPYCAHQVSFVDYHSASLPVNISNDDIENEAALFGACTLGLVDGGWTSTWEPGHKSWLDRNYFRVWDFNCNYIFEDWPYTDRRRLIETITSEDSRERLLEGETGQKGGGGDPNELAPQQAQEVMLYPNPAGNTLFVKSVSADVVAAVYRIEILDMTGRNSIKTIEGQNRIDVSDLKTGIYYAKVFTSADHFVYRKFSKL